MGNGDIVRDGTRRAVGRQVLRRLSGMVQEWQDEEREKAALVRHLAFGIVLFVTALLTVFFLR